MPLPTKNGVGASCVMLPPGTWPTVLEFLVDRFPHISREEIVARMQRGDVLDAHGTQISPDHTYTAREKLYYYRDIPDEARIPFDEVILFRDEHIIAVDKPHFLPVAPVGRYVQESLLVRLKRTLGIASLAPMHRIDRETAGVVLFTVEAATRGEYQSLFETRAVEKTYQAIAGWRDDLQFPLARQSRLVESENFMQMCEVPGEVNAETAILIMEQRGAFARYRLQPRTGKKHQLRAHMNALGIPILYDQIYPVHRIADEQNYTEPLQLLAESIAFRDPITGKTREFVSARKLLELSMLTG